MKITLQRLLLLWTACSILILALAPSSAAADPKPTGKMAFQGFLTDASGNARGASGPVNITATFRLYNSPTAAVAAAIWAESQVVTVDKGHFSVVLGEGNVVNGTTSGTDLSTFFIGDNANGRYLGVTVNNESEISPRIQFLAAPYAHLSRYATELVGSSGTSVLKVAAGTVGINLSAAAVPASALDVGGTVTATGLNVNGAASATSFSGNGGNLTGLNASQLTLGSLPDARLSANVARRDAANSLTGNQSIIAGDLQFDNGHVINAKNMAGFYENFFWPRWLDNITYMNYGSAGFNLRNNSSVTTMFMNNNGNVGLGLSPSAKLHIYEATGTAAGADNGTILIDHDNAGGASSIVFRSKVNRGGADYGYIQYQDAATLNGVGEAAVFTIGIQNDANDHLALMSSGNVGVGTQNPSEAKLQVNGVGTATFGLHTTLNYNGVSGLNIGTYTRSDVSIKGSDGVHGAFFRATSDARIKNIKGLSDAANDLATLNRVEIVDYTYRDVTKGNTPMKKVIGQQIEKIFPQAVKQTTDVVPDIYKNTVQKDGWVELATDLKVGDRVRLIGERNEAIVPVLEVRDGAFRTAFKPEKGDKVFVYGREVHDFRNVDYEAIAMLNVSATQELARKVAALEKSEARVTELEAKVAKMSDLEKELAQLKKAVAQIAALRGNGPASTVAAAGEIGTQGSR